MKSLFNNKKQCIYLTLAMLSMFLAITSHVFAATHQQADHAASNTRAHANTDTTSHLLGGQVQQRIRNLGENVLMRMRATALRLTNIGERLEARIMFVGETGVATEAATAELETAQQLLRETTNRINTLEDAIAALSTSEHPREQFMEIKTALLEIRDNLREAHGYLRDSLAALKAALKNTDTASGVRDAVVDERVLEHAATSTTTE